MEGEDFNILNEPAAAYGYSSDLTAKSKNVLMRVIRGGLAYDRFESIVSKLPFSMEEWSSYLHLSERTIHRYRKDQKNFDALQSEKILQISLLYKRGVDVLGSKENFNLWLDFANLALGNIKPKELLDNAFGIALLEEELTRIEHGILA